MASPSSQSPVVSTTRKPIEERPADLSWGSFTDEAPWELDHSDVRWLTLAATLRRAAQAEVPGLTKPSKLPPGARVVTVAGRLGAAIGPWLVNKKRGGYTSPEASRAAVSKRLRLAAEALGPTYIKLGQLLATRADLFPPEVTKALSSLHASVAPIPFVEVDHNGVEHP